LSPIECDYVGDNIELDVLGALNAGLRGIWIDRSRSNAGRDVATIHDLAELASILKEE